MLIVFPSPNFVLPRKISKNQAFLKAGLPQPLPRHPLLELPHLPHSLPPPGMHQVEVDLGGLQGTTGLSGTPTMLCGSQG